MCFALSSVWGQSPVSKLCYSTKCVQFNTLQLDIAIYARYAVSKMLERKEEGRKEG